MPIQLRSLPPITFSNPNEPTQLTLDDKITSTSITIMADKNNVGIVTVGGDDIDPDNAIQIEPKEIGVIEHTAPGSFGDDTLFRLSQIYAMSSNAGDKIRVVYMKRVK